jgi:transcriptional regulator with XRE-family HTH domain
MKNKRTKRFSIRELREVLDCKQLDIARFLRLSQATIARVEGNSRSLPRAAEPLMQDLISITALAIDSAKANSSPQLGSRRTAVKYLNAAKSERMGELSDLKMRLSELIAQYYRCLKTEAILLNMHIQESTRQKARTKQLIKLLLAALELKKEKCDLHHQCLLQVSITENEAAIFKIYELLKNMS